MVNGLSWQEQQHTLILFGELDRETLLPLWQQRKTLLANKTQLDVSQLTRVDSSGLALLIHLRAEQAERGGDLALIGGTDRLRTLATLYNLQQIISI